MLVQENGVAVITFGMTDVLVGEDEVVQEARRVRSKKKGGKKKEESLRMNDY